MERTQVLELMGTLNLYGMRSANPSASVSWVVCIARQSGRDGSDDLVCRAAGMRAFARRHPCAS